MFQLIIQETSYYIFYYYYYLSGLLVFVSGWNYLMLAGRPRIINSLSYFGFCVLKNVEFHYCLNPLSKMYSLFNGASLTCTTAK